MTEPIEKWKEEHKRLLLATNEWCFANFQSRNGVYYDWKLQASWEGFLMAKRSAPVVYLPMPRGSYDFVADYQEEVIESLTSAGIQYRIKGD